MQILDLGRKTYLEAWELQKQLLEQRATGQIEDTLILVEHEPVYTVGRAAQTHDASEPSASVALHEIKVRKLGTVPVVEVERGGKLTFHGPGQLVGYPIFALPNRDLRTYLRDVEHILMSTLVDETLLPAKPCPASLLLEPGQLQTGVWIRDKKVASIGIAVRKWITYHGFALNISTDLRYFEAVEPCGFQGSIMTSLAHELGPAVAIEALTSNIKRTLAKKFTELSERYNVFSAQTASAPETIQASTVDQKN